jgi:putative transposase
VKYRRDVITPKISERLKDIAIDIASAFGVQIVTQETDVDHFHILFKAKPTTDLSKFINSLKGVSSRRLRQEFPEVKQKLWKGFFWSPSYCLITTGQVSLDVLMKYVEQQGKER